MTDQPNDVEWLIAQLKSAAERIEYLERELSEERHSREVAAQKSWEFADRLRAMEWRPIETAPRDGTPVLASLGPFMYIVFWSDHPNLKHPNPWWEQGNAEWENGKWIGYHEHFYPASPTHWMPLPMPPNVSRETQEWD